MPQASAEQVEQVESTSAVKGSNGAGEVEDASVQRARAVADAVVAKPKSETKTKPKTKADSKTKKSKGKRIRCQAKGCRKLCKPKETNCPSCLDAMLADDPHALSKRLTEEEYNQFHLLDTEVQNFILMIGNAGMQQKMLQSEINEAQLRLDNLITKNDQAFAQLEAQIEAFKSQLEGRQAAFNDHQKVIADKYELEVGKFSIMSETRTLVDVRE
jgi:hypothetical protein